MAVLIAEAFNSMTARDPLSSLVTSVIADVALDALKEQLSETNLPESERSDAARKEALETATLQSVSVSNVSDQSGLAQLSGPAVLRSGAIIGQIRPEAEGPAQPYASAA